MGAPVVHFEIMSKDSKKTGQFYAAMFSWDIDANNPMNYGVIKPDPSGGIGGGLGQVMDNMSPTVTFYVGVDDVQASLDKAVALGGRVVVPVTVVPDMVTFAQFADPEGNVIGLVKNMPPPPKATKRSKAKKSSSKKKSSKGKKKSRRR